MSVKVVQKVGAGQPGRGIVDYGIWETETERFLTQQDKGIDLSETLR
jgi:hypothetical protein